ncbi:MAG: hypothetical protein COA82_05160 [Alkaliphilus sp.]|nr:PilZ domain-containing protein [Alkaliphilus transvaalensis]PHS35265.1 MAG: hypothetical protein COA82_05160 [Alkaliphilus sp.]
MGIISELKIGIKLEIAQTSDESYYNKQIITSQLIDKNEEFLFISQPMFKGMSYHLYVTDKIKIIFNDKDKGTFHIIAEVISKKTNKITIYGVKPIGEPVAVQRREYFRIDMLKNVVIRETDVTREIDCFSKNISGGGVKLICRKKIDVGSTINIKLHFKEGVMITTQGKIKKAIKLEEDNRYELSIEFVNLREGTRNRIISFIFEHQRLLRKRGLI